MPVSEIVRGSQMFALRVWAGERIWTRDLIVPALCLAVAPWNIFEERIRFNFVIFFTRFDDIFFPEACFLEFWPKNSFIKTSHDNDTVFPFLKFFLKNWIIQLWKKTFWKPCDPHYLEGQIRWNSEDIMSGTLTRKWKTLTLTFIGWMENKSSEWMDLCKEQNKAWIVLSRLPRQSVPYPLGYSKLQRKGERYYFHGVSFP